MPNETLTLTINGNSREAVQAVKRVTESMGQLAGVSVKAGADVERSAKRAGDGLEKLASRADRLVSVGTKVAGVLAVIAGGVGLVARSGVEMNETVAQAERGLTHLSGSADRAKGFIRDLREEAQLTAPTFQELLPIAQQLAAAYGPGGLGKVIPTIRAFNDVSVTLGADVEAQKRALLGFRQLLTSFRGPQLEEIKQITENLPGLNVGKILVDRFGSADTEVLQKAEISGREVAEAILAGMQKEFGGASEKAADSLAVLAGNVKQQFQEIAGELTTELTPAIKAGLKIISDELRGLAQDKDAVEALKEPFRDLAKGIRSTAEAVRDLIRWFRDLSPAEKKSAIESATLALKIAAIGTAALVAVGHVAKLVTGLAGLKGALAALPAAGPIGLGVAGVVAGGAAIRGAHETGGGLDFGRLFNGEGFDFNRLRHAVPLRKQMGTKADLDALAEEEARKFPTGFHAQQRVKRELDQLFAVPGPEAAKRMDELRRQLRVMQDAEKRFTRQGKTIPDAVFKSLGVPPPRRDGPPVLPADPQGADFADAKARVAAQAEEKKRREAEKARKKAEAIAEKARREAEERRQFMAQLELGAMPRFTARQERDAARVEAAQKRDAASREAHEKSRGEELARARVLINQAYYIRLVEIDREYEQKVKEAEERRTAKLREQIEQRNNLQQDYQQSVIRQIEEITAAGLAGEREAIERILEEGRVREEEFQKEQREREVIRSLDAEIARQRRELEEVQAEAQGRGALQSLLRRRIQSEEINLDELRKRKPGQDIERPETLDQARKRQREILARQQRIAADRARLAALDSRSLRGAVDQAQRGTALAFEEIGLQERTNEGRERVREDIRRLSLPADDRQRLELEDRIREQIPRASPEEVQKLAEEWQDALKPAGKVKTDVARIGGAFVDLVGVLKGGGNKIGAAIQALANVIGAIRGPGSDVPLIGGLLGGLGSAFGFDSPMQDSKARRWGFDFGTAFSQGAGDAVRKPAVPGLQAGGAHTFNITQNNYGPINSQLDLARANEELAWTMARTQRLLSAG